MVIVGFAESDRDLFPRNVPAFKLKKIIKNAVRTGGNPGFKICTSRYVYSFARYTTNLGINTQLGWRNQKCKFNFGVDTYCKATT
jgi:hypothetical protein